MHEIKKSVTEKTKKVITLVSKKSNQLPLWVWLVGITIITLLVIYVYKPKSVPVTVFPESATLVRSVTVTGKVEQSSEIATNFQQTGMIKRVLVTAGQRVSTGKLLAQLDLGTLSAEEAEAKINVESAELERKKNNTDISQKESSLTSDSESAKQNVILLTQKLLSSDLQVKPDSNFSNSTFVPVITGTFSDIVDSAQYTLELYASNSQSGVSATFSGYESGTVELSQYRPIKLGTKGLYIQLPVGTNNSLLGTKWVLNLPNVSSAQYVSNAYQLGEARKNYDETLRNKQNSLSLQNVTFNGKNSYDIAIDKARSQLAKIQAAIRLRGIYAPISGTIGKVDIKVGSQASISGDGITILGGDSFIVKLKVPESSIGGVTNGSTVDISIDSLPGVNLSGSVQSINTAVSYVEGTPVYETTVLIDMSKADIRSGMNASGKIVIDTYDSKSIIPDTAITVDEKSKKSSVMVYDSVNKKSFTKPVNILFRGNDGRVAVTRLDSTDAVIIVKQ